MHWSIERFGLSLIRPLSTARGRIDERTGWLVRVAGTGTSGIGTAMPLSGWTEPVEQCRSALEDGIRALNQASDIETARRTVEGVDAPAARHGLSLALDDFLARRAGVSLSRWYLEDDPISAVRVNATVGDGPPAETRSKVLDAIDDGYRTVKCKVGVRSLSADRDRIQAARDAGGEDLRLRVDANAAWTRAEARSALDWLADASVEYLEQPIEPEDLAGHRTLRNETVPIALDETLGDRSIEDVLDAAACDVVVLKPMVLGGVDRTIAAARRAMTEDVAPVVTTTIDDAIATTGAVHAAAAIDPPHACGLGTLSMVSPALVETDPIPVERGRIRVPQGDGLGIDPETVGVA